ncbi:MAG: hypothetical protein F9K40_00780 [Kofleriaceae bacterium]|nr:MAG: hypothetical protein F9K40_00780 [Kofleriaceae bacterium]
MSDLEPTLADFHQPPAPPRRSRVGTWLRRAFAVSMVAASLTCGGDGGSTLKSTTSGVAYWSGGGPVRNATIIAWQMVDGERTFELGRTTTDENGRWEITTEGYEHIEYDVVGGSYAEASGGEVTLDSNTILRGIVLDVPIGGTRSGITISPLTDLAVTLGHARRAANKEDTYGDSVHKAVERLTNHFGFDPLTTPVASPAAPASSPTAEVKYGLVLAGLSQLARSVAEQQGATTQSINTVVWTRTLGRDAGSAEALFDGVGAAPLFVGASCPPPPGCSVEGPGCYADCRAQSNTLKARIGAQILSFLRTSQNGTTLTRNDVEAWLEEVRTRVDGDLFGSDPAEEWDQVGPAITWVTPVADATVAGSIAVEVTATDPLGIASLTVTAETPTPLQLVDTDPAPERFAATFSTVGLPEGPLTLTATALDTQDNRSDAPRSILLDNVSGGTVSAIVYKGRVENATVRIYEFQNGVRAAQVGSATTASDGSVTNVMVANGYSGPLLVEAGFSGTYPEEAATATVTLDVNDRMRTIVPSYAEGNAISNLVVSPLSSFAVTYFEYLQQTNQGGSTLAERWTTARTAMETHFGVANIYNLTPQAPSEMTTFNAGARYGMIMVGLSETARMASTLGGGDGGTFGSAMNAMRVFRVLDTDLADGCWDGRQGATQLYFGGTEAVTVRSVRRDLANAIVSYLNDGARNQTPYAGAADILSQLDTLSDGGGNNAPGSCSATSRLNPDAGTAFDQTPPVIAFTGATPPAGFVRGTITVDAVATDDLDTRPTLRFTSPAGTADSDGDETDSDAHHTFDTTMLPDGPLVVALESVDDAGNVGAAARTFTVDNQAPTISFNIPDGSWHGAPGPNVSYGHDEMNVSSVTAMLNGGPFSNGQQVSAQGQHTLVVTVIDQAGASTTATLTFYVDTTVPTLALGTVTPSGTVVKDIVTITVTADDNLKQFGSLGSDIAVTATGVNGAVTPTSVSSSVDAMMRRVVVATFNTDVIPVPDGQLTVRFNVMDRAGNPAAELPVVRTVDNTDPVVVISGVSMNAWYPSAPTVSFTQNDANRGTTTATLNGAAFANNTQVTTPGMHTLVVTAVDQAGNTKSETVVFYVDLANPTLTVQPPNPNGMWIRGMFDVTVEATDTMMGLGSLPDNIVATVTSSPGTTSPGTSYPAASGGAKRIRNQIDTTAIAGSTVAMGSLSVRYDVTDASGRMATPVTVAVMIDNNPPHITIDNVGSQPIPTFTSDPTPTITGTVETGGSPVTITLTIQGRPSVAVTPSGGTWSYTVPDEMPLADGQYAINATATDAAGNSAAADPVTMNIDTAGPTVTFQTSNVLDERTRCTVTVHASTSTGEITSPGTPVTYSCSGTPTDLSPGGASLGKYVARMASTNANPIAWNITTSDVGGAGVASASDTVRFRIYRTAPGATWVNATPGILSGTTLPATANVLSTDWTELLTHSASFTIEIQAKDQLGNWGPSAMRTWTHVPLAHPVALAYRGNAPTSSTDPVWEYSLHRHSLFPLTGQTGPANAMSSGFQASAPRALFVFDLVNPHPAPVNVGFFLPAISGATYTKRIWDTSPWIAATSMTAPNNGTCSVNPWPSPNWSARINHSAPYNCNTGSCTCNGSGWTQPADSLPGTSTVGLPDNTIVVRAVDLSALPAQQQLSVLGLTSMVNGRPFYEFQIPAAPSDTQGKHIRVLVGFPNLDFYAPFTSPLDGVQESDGLGSEQHKTTDGYVATMTASFYERWGACHSSSGGSCTAARVRRHLRALVEARVSVPAQAMQLNVRQRATNSSTAAAEEPPTLLDITARRNTSSFLWETCETPSYGGGACTPNIPTTANSAL